jgi:uncharacterized membrane protein
MWTTVLAFLILFMGFITFAAGAVGALMLFFEEVSNTERVQFKYYAMVIGLISGGLGLIDPRPCVVCFNCTLLLDDERFLVAPHCCHWSCI